jgi:WD40 repeat protein
MYAKNITKYLIFSVAIITTINAMELPKKKSARQKPPQQSLIEIFAGIKKEQYDRLPSDLKKIIVCNVPQLINKPWHFVEHKITTPVLASRFTQDNKLIFASGYAVNWFDCKQGSIIRSEQYNNLSSFPEVCFDSTAQHIAVVSRNGGYIADLLNVQKPVVEIEPKYLSNGICSVYYNHDDSILGVVLDNGWISFYDIKTGKCKNIGAYGPVGSIKHLCSSSIESRSALVKNTNTIIIGNDFHEGRCFAKKEWSIKYFKKEAVSSLCFNHDGKLLLVGFYNGKVSVFDVEAKQEIWSLFFKKWFCSMCFDVFSNRIALGDQNGIGTSAYILNQYNNYTLEQLLLRKTMHLWLQLKKPSHRIKSLKQVFKNIASLFNVDHAELHEVWTTFPIFMQSIIKETMLARVKKYKHRGKKKFHLL